MSRVHARERNRVKSSQVATVALSYQITIQRSRELTIERQIKELFIEFPSISKTFIQFVLFCFVLGAELLICADLKHPQAIAVHETEGRR